MKQYRRTRRIHQDEDRDHLSAVEQEEIPSSTEHERLEKEKEESKEACAIAQAILSIKTIETEIDRKEKNRIAAKKSREKKLQYIESLEAHLYQEKSKNQHLHQKIGVLYNVLEKLLLETEAGIVEKRPGTAQIANIFVNCDQYIALPPRHKNIIGNLKYFLFTSKNLDI
ncbi:hypothetical protein NEAUS04_1322 [Nematocida ausubeli]|uniref:BZIP domain-containing protein n=1 Tax=Nematocida ausubeli (strain ATCC PRA-371 / ERTm2) TaxID=1913371 RepID=H8ZDW2_NEMA1|nr:uncharacterized protein NESG_00113 [Nematocida ausubeli]EHY65337.1 hypothetical protein NERG_01783 [Nematocida ausubeli]KAI5132462.1 hypothetical protein NEAUS06_0157 [Nematocida ausubeli]KAI5132769.1 hypothetical protein NEAUS07_0277 [Nematocida ausubeli]KAI5148806.1 hypothetical protein NEAUS05_1531 [Nematocida ausubeli]KAI5159138.1 hypothetical protein NEAUS03_0051 [Nematocida ausubeli]